MTTVVIAPPAAGNIGDQALVESALHNIVGDVHLIVRKAGDVQLEHLPATGRALTEIVLPDLIYGRGLARRRDVRRYRSLLNHASSVRIVGADIMDGRYCLRASIARARMAQIAVEHGVPAAVLGFSWSPKARARAVRAVKRASDAGVVLYARDPASHRRLDKIGVQPASAADVVFTQDSADRDAARRVLDQIGVTNGERYVLVNASGLVGKSAQVASYVEVIRSVRARGITPVLLPHVSRKTADDQHALDQIVAAVTDPLPRVSSLQLPDVVRGLCAGATAVVTGRMHLGVMSLRMGTPAVIVSTQGKVEGLMEMFGMPECCVGADPQLSDMPVTTTAVLDDHDGYVAKIAERLPSVIALAERNFG